MTPFVVHGVVRTTPVRQSLAMGKEAHLVSAVFADGSDQGRLQYEAPKLIFRGAVRRVFEGAALEGVRAEGGDLTLADGSRFALGEIQAARWAEAIANPKSRLDKIGVKPGMRVAVLDVADEALADELAARGAPAVNDLTGLDVLSMRRIAQETSPGSAI